MPYGFSPNRAAILSGGIATWKVKAQGDAAYYSFLRLQETSVQLISLNSPDSYQRTQGFSFQFVAKARVMATSITNLIKVLDTLATKNIEHKITSTGGTTYCSELITGKTFFGLKWRFVGDAKMDSNRYIELETRRYLTKAEYALLTGTPPADGTPNPADSLFPMNSLLETDIAPASISKFELKKTTDGSYENIGTLRNAKYEFELLTFDDQDGRNLGLPIVKAHIEAESMQASTTELGLWDDVAVNKNDVKLTLPDGAVCTLTDDIGVQFDYNSAGDSQDGAYVKVLGDGNIAIADWDGLWT